MSPLPWMEKLDVRDFDRTHLTLALTLALSPILALSLDPEPGPDPGPSRHMATLYLLRLLYTY